MHLECPRKHCFHSFHLKKAMTTLAFDSTRPATYAQTTVEGNPTSEEPTGHSTIKNPETSTTEKEYTSSTTQAMDTSAVAQTGSETNI